MDTFPDALNKIRKEQGLSYQALAERVHGSPGHMQRLCTGLDKPKLTTLFRLCLALNLDVTAADTLFKLAGFAPLLPPSPLPKDQSVGLESVKQ